MWSRAGPTRLRSDVPASFTGAFSVPLVVFQPVCGLGAPLAFRPRICACGVSTVGAGRISSASACSRQACVETSVVMTGLRGSPGVGASCTSHGHLSRGWAPEPWSVCPADSRTRESGWPTRARHT